MGNEEIMKFSVNFLPNILWEEIVIKGTPRVKVLQKLQNRTIVLGLLEQAVWMLLSAQYDSKVSHLVSELEKKGMSAEDVIAAVSTLLDLELIEITDHLWESKLR